MFKLSEKLTTFFLVAVLVISSFACSVRAYASATPTDADVCTDSDADFVIATDEGFVNTETMESNDGTFVDESALIAAVNAEHNETISYYVHQQNIGDSQAVGAGGVAGCVGTNNRLEALYITRTSADTSEVSGDILYSAHCQNVGWRGTPATGTTLFGFDDMNWIL